MQWVRDLVVDVPDFPKPGILFRDITPVLSDGKALRAVIDAFAERYGGRGITHVAGIESRGFIFGTALAYALGIGVVLVRKPGKLPRATYSAVYELEYGEDAVHVHQDAVKPGERVVLIDDLLATGGTARAALDVLQQTGAEVVEFGAVIELTNLGGRARLGDTPVHALLKY